MGGHTKEGTQGSWIDGCTKKSIDPTEFAHVVLRDWASGASGNGTGGNSHGHKLHSGFVSKALACQLGNESGGRGGGLATQNTEVTQRFLQLDSVILSVISESVFISLPNCLTTCCYFYLKTG
jgi:hypothetical protein